MTKLNKIGQTALAALGAIILSSTAIGAAVGPAHAVETAPIVYNA
jgi:hypothetical protein